jgi:hypothetical protein
MLKRAQDSARDNAALAEPDAQIALEFEIRSIYDRSIVRLRARAGRSFALSIGDGGKWFRVTHGTMHANNRVVAAEVPGGHIVEADVTGWIEERRIQLARRWWSRATSTPTGMRWFPFVASQLRASITSEHVPITSLIVVVREGLRVLWNGGAVTVRESPFHFFSEHAYAANAWEYRYVWSAGKGSDAGVEVTLPLRRGGPEFDRMVAYPLWSFVLGVAIITAAGVVAPDNVALAVLGTLLALMLRQWSESDRLTHMTLLAAIYLSAAFIASGWTTVVILTGWWAALASPLPALFAWQIHRISRSYAATCLPPARTARAWGQISEWLGAGNSRTSRGMERRLLKSHLGQPAGEWTDRPGGGLKFNAQSGDATVDVFHAGHGGGWTVEGTDRRGCRLCAPLVGLSDDDVAALLPPAARDMLERIRPSSDQSAAAVT